MSDHGLHCLLTGVSIRKKNQIKNTPDTPKIENGLVQLIKLEESTKFIWVKLIEQKTRGVSHEMNTTPVMLPITA